MKKLLALLMVVAMLFGFAGCAESNNTESTKKSVSSAIETNEEVYTIDNPKIVYCVVPKQKKNYKSKIDKDLYKTIITEFCGYEIREYDNLSDWNVGDTDRIQIEFFDEDLVEEVMTLKQTNPGLYDENVQDFLFDWAKEYVENSDIKNPYNLGYVFIIENSNWIIQFRVGFNKSFPDYEEPKDYFVDLTYWRNSDD